MDCTVQPSALNACATRVVPVKTSMARRTVDGNFARMDAIIWGTREFLLPKYLTPWVADVLIPTGPAGGYLNLFTRGL